MTISYETDLVERAPGWLQGPHGAALLRLFGRSLDILLAAHKAAVKCRFVAVAPADALPHHGDARGLARYPGDTDATYRARLAGAWSFWQQAGTAAGILAALDACGFHNAAVYTARGSAPPSVSPWPPDSDTANWSRFWVYLDVTADADNPFGWAPVAWGERDWGDGWSWGSTATPGEASLVRGVIRTFKAAHEVCAGVYVKLPGGTLLLWTGME